MAGIYLHIPFCKQACTYCNFHFSTSLKQKDELLDALLKEIQIQKHWLRDEKVETVYFGGGTPSLLSQDELMRIFDALHENFQIGTLLECTLEANPDDLSKEYLKKLKNTLVDRLSIGVQSFRDGDLKYMNRAHNAQQSDYAIKAAQDAGFSNLSIDLIYGTPGLSDVDWKHNIDRMSELDIPHFSSYALTVEEGTALYYNIAKKKSDPVDPAQSAAQAEILMEEAARLGYEQYEISNFAKPGCYAKHNTSYWQGTPYLGLGPSAHSFDGEKVRQWNVANNSRYIRALMDEGKLLYEQETLTPEQRMNEYLMTSLRTMWGCDLNKIESAWGVVARQEIQKSAETFIERGWMIQEKSVLRLTNAGKLFADGIAGEMFV